MNDESEDLIPPMDHSKEAMWKTHMDAFKTSGFTQPEYCLRAGIKHKRYRKDTLRCPAKILNIYLSISYKIFRRSQEKLKAVVLHV